MERKRHFRWDRLLECILWAMFVALVVWVTASYFNVILHNCEESPTYKDWNFFTSVF